MRIKSLKYLSITFTFKRKRFTNNFKLYALRRQSFFVCVLFVCDENFMDSQ